MKITQQRLLKIYEGARRYLTNPENWTQGSYKDEHQVCLIGGLELAAGCEVRNEANILLPLALSIRGGAGVVKRAEADLKDDLADEVKEHITGFNDADGRRHKTILSALNRAIERIRASIKEKKRSRQVKNIISDAIRGAHGKTELVTTD